MEETKKEKIFVNGLVSKDVPPTAPEWILGKLSIQVDDLGMWLKNNDKLADANGWINITVMRSKSTGKRYIEVDTWKPTAKTEDRTPVQVTTGYNPATGEVNVVDIPF